MYESIYVIEEDDHVCLTDYVSKNPPRPLLVNYGERSAHNSAKDDATTHCAIIAALSILLQKYPSLAATRDVQTGLFPFMHAATLGSSNDLQLIYSLIQHIPVLAHGLSA